MKNSISVVIAAHNDELDIEEALKSASWVDEVIVVFANNTIDRSPRIAKKYTNKILFSENNLGLQRNRGIDISQNEWILILDTDERISQELKAEILQEINNNKYNGYFIPYKNHFLNHRLKWGNQRYEKKRLFKKKKGGVETLKVHPEIIIEEPVGKLQGKIYHYSFRSIPQTLRKFTYYASVEAPLLYSKGERVSLKKLTLYPIHMFWSIFFKDEGWRDGIWGFGLASCFMYYELAKYTLLLWEEIKRLKGEESIRNN